MMLKKPRVLSTEIRGLKRKGSEQWSRNTRVIYGKGVEAALPLLGDRLRIRKWTERSGIGAGFWGDYSNSAGLLNT